MFGRILLAHTQGDPCLGAAITSITTSLNNAGACAVSDWRAYAVTPVGCTIPAGGRLKFNYYFGSSSTGTPNQAAYATTTSTKVITMTFYGSTGTEPAHTLLGNYYFRCYVEVLDSLDNVCATSETDTVGPHTTWICG